MTSPEPTSVETYHDDVWGDEAGVQSVESRHEMLSDLPTIKRQHMTDGYREGLSAGKAKVMQQGFDMGYPTGIQIGLRVGKIYGILEGYLACKNLDTATRELVLKSHQRAKEELAIANLLNNMSEEVMQSFKVLPESTLAIIEKWERVLVGVAHSQSCDTMNSTERQEAAMS